jgi:hypothetical protein
VKTSKQARGAKKEKLSRSEKSKGHRGTGKEKSRYAVTKGSPPANPRGKKEEPFTQ